MASLESLKQDLAEFQRLLEQSSRDNVKQVLMKEIKRVEAEILAKEQRNELSQKVPSKPYISTVKIVNYAWDQSDKFVKLYVTLKNVHTLPKESIITSCKKKSVELQILGLENKNHSLTINNLMHEVKPEDSYHKVKTDMVVVFLRKVSSTHWPYVTEAEKKAKDAKTPKFDENESPDQSLMSLMKQMYDDGDDEMKRTIAKAWTEARDKQAAGEYNF